MNIQDYINVTIILAINIVILVLIYLAVSFIRLKKQKKPFEELHSKLEVGHQVLLSNGFYGKVIELTKEVAMVEIAPKVTVKVSRFAIQSIVEGK
jgi:preprotein translocase YajC subunit